MNKPILKLPDKMYTSALEIEIPANRLARRFLIMRDIPCTPENIKKAQAFIDGMFKACEEDD